MRSLVASLLVVAAANAAPAQRVVLELRPRFGDTVWIRLDQSTEVSTSRKGVMARPVVTTLSMFSRAIVEASTAASAMILAITDSVSVHSTDRTAAVEASETQRQLAGRQMRLKLLPDGTVSVADDHGSVPKHVNEMVSLMPASFPRGSVTIGDTWLREMPIPPASSSGAPMVVKAAFRLDSVSTDYDVAYLSMRGTVQERGAASPVASGVQGSVSGSMTVDRRRGWLSASRFSIQLKTFVAGSAAGGPPIQYLMKVTQQMRVIDKR
jgi:hypothetical protein